MGYIDLGGNLGIVATSEPATQTNGAFVEPALTGDRRTIVSNMNEYASVWGQAFGFCIPSITIPNTTETNALIISNPTGSGKVLKLTRLLFTPPLAVGGLLGTTQTQIVFKFYTTSVVSANGTLTTAVGCRQVGQFAAVAVIGLGPTVTTRGAIFAQRAVYSQSFGDTDQRFDMLRILDPGNNLIISATASAANITTGITGEFAEMNV